MLPKKEEFFYVKKSEHLDRGNDHRRFGDRVVPHPFQYRPEFFRNGGSAGYDGRGLVPGFFASFLWGVLHILIGTAYILTPLQGFI